LRVGLDGQNNVGSVVQTSSGLPAPFAPEGIRARVRYNRGRVDVLLGPGGAGGGALSKVLAAEIIPISFASAGESAIFGFTASTGDLSETAEVDDLIVTRFGCDDIQEVAEISGAPAEPVAVGATIVLDGSGSSGGVGEEEEPVSHLWSIVSGEAQIVGPANGPTVSVRLLSEGPVTVRLMVDDGQCSNPASVSVVMTAGGTSLGNWIRCDCSGDGQRDISDPISLLGWLFLGAGAPPCPEACECSGDGATDISDAIFDLGYQFLGGPAPAPPYPDCESFPACGDTCAAGR